MLLKLVDKLNYKDINEYKQILLLSKEIIPYNNKIKLYKDYFKKYQDLSNNVFEENKQLAKTH